MKKELGTKEKWNGKTKESVRHDSRQDDFLRRWGLLRRAQNVRGVSRTSSFLAVPLLFEPYPRKAGYVDPAINRDIQNLPKDL